MGTVTTILSFATAKAFRAWLQKNHASSTGIQLRIFKKDSGVNSITYAEALDEALCHGWIDGQKMRGDESSWLQKFSPRRPKSGWSKINTQHAERLLSVGKMHAAGLNAIASAKKDGRWQSAYDSQRTAAPPDDFLAELNQNPKAKTFFATLNSQNRYAILYRLQTAKKPETRLRRMGIILEMLKRGETFHPQPKK